MKLQELLSIFEQHVPPRLAAEWDNVGLLVGRQQATIHRVMTTLDITTDTLQEAIDRRADLIVTHHPLPFKSLSRITDESHSGALLCTVMQHQINVYSPHSAWDSAIGGINDQLAAAMKLQDVRPLIALGNADEGVGRYGKLKTSVSIADIFAAIEAVTGAIQARSNQESSDKIQTIGICCGSGGSMLGNAIDKGCDALLTGEATYHQCLEANANGVALIMIGHHASESFAMRVLAERMADWFSDLEIWSANSDVNVLVR